MKIEYDQKADAIYIRLSSGTIADSDEVRPNVFLDTDANGRVLGIEMLGVSKLTDKPNEMALEMLTT
jgi:uncharacterized protein YuzE